ncbi:MAG: MmcQ/YjbR family DNA-binding protein [Roseitalea sp.]|jgi:hypothetical protein|nr:MmcQ/YjbR family DNA-binding protein [Roseitalea sp.]MBO6721898.1 MmcQ/YjbR family DNA-binding protein [Roseitalea sp.]MBO6743069.1 MmcQ/YjbR family DNA-binding protein [Roseitalea sp.]
MAAEPGETAIDRLFAELVSAFAETPGVGLKKMLKSEALQIHGKSFAYPSPEGLVLKLPVENVDALEQAGKGNRLVVGKRTMREWIVLDGVDATQMKELAEAAYRFTGAKK